MKNQLNRILMPIVFVLLGMMPAWSQEKLTFSIAAFQVNLLDLTAENPNYVKTDGNGDKMAIIKVSSNNPQDNLNEYEFNFGNMRHIKEDHNGELWIYVQRNAKHVTITRQGYSPISRYDLRTTIESGKTYEMRLTAEDKKVLTQMVRFNIKPTGVNPVVTVKRSFKENAKDEVFGTVDENGSVAKNLEYGQYTYKVMAQNYHTSEGSFTLSDSKTTHTETVELQPDFSTITFKVDANADIYINGEKVGTGKWTGVLKSGNYQVECRQADHKSSSQYIQILENNNQTIQLAAPDPILGTVSIISNPLGASITIDGKPYGETPKLIDLIIGRHKLELSSDGYKSETKYFDVKEEQTVEVSATLGKETEVMIHSNPSAALYIDGKYFGNTPNKFEGEMGAHKVELVCDGYRRFNKTVYLGRAKQETFALIRQYVKKNDFYVEAGIGVGTNTAVEAAIGGHIANFNLEVDYSHCFMSGQDIYWNYVGSGTDREPQVSSYKPSLVFGGKIGYGINLGTRIKLTPQIGYRHTQLSEDGTEHVSGAYCSSCTIGLRSYIALAKVFGVSVTPEYAFAVSKSEGFKLLSDVSSPIRNLEAGFNAKLALVLTF